MQTAGQCVGYALWSRPPQNRKRSAWRNIGSGDDDCITIGIRVKLQRTQYLDIGKPIVQDWPNPRRVSPP
jgi:hypothetical protein